MDVRTFRQAQRAAGLQDDVPLVLYSHHADVGLDERKLHTVLCKPFEYEELRATIEDVCEGPPTR
jgi:hypothetical protein